MYLFVLQNKYKVYCFTDGQPGYTRLRLNQQHVALFTGMVDVLV